MVILISVVKDWASWFNLWSHTSKMDKLKEHIQHVMWKFKDNKNAIEMAKKISKGYGHQVQN